MTCKDCLHYEACKDICYDISNGKYDDKDFNKEQHPNYCVHFTDFSEWSHLPCKVGDVFFRTIPWRNKVDECTVSSLTQKSDKTWKIRLTSETFKTVFEIITNDIGKTVFLTREEAENSLSGRGQG